MESEPQLREYAKATSLTRFFTSAVRVAFEIADAHEKSDSARQTNVTKLFKIIQSEATDRGFSKAGRKITDAYKAKLSAAREKRHALTLEKVCSSQYQSIKTTTTDRCPPPDNATARIRS